MDADCLIAGTLTPSGATSELLDRWQAGEFEVVVCPQLIREVRKALLHPRIAKKYDIRRGEAEEFARRLSEEGIRLDDPAEPPRVAPDDPMDDYLVALAVAAKADALVTRDRHFDKVKVRGLPILRANQMLRRIGPS
ncbi:MAG: putative toxin-antitoxin system toxin component, PIN family [Actinomycetota bacterium]